MTPHSMLSASAVVGHGGMVRDWVGQRQFERILQYPEDDGVRLRYADWLERNDLSNKGDKDRAEFIRTQIALNQLRHIKHEALTTEQIFKKTALEQREEELLLAHREEWERPLRQLFARGIAFRRGLPDAVIMNAGDFIKQADRLFARAPITKVRLDHASEYARELADLPYLERIDSLDLSANSMRNGDAAVIGDSAYAANLRSLDLTNNRLTGLAVRALATSPSLTNLHTLALGGNSLGVRGAEALANARQWSNLRHLDVRNATLGSKGARLLAQSPLLANLCSLNLFGNYIGDAGAQSLAESPYLTEMTDLGLERNRIGDKGARALGESRHLPRLTKLDLSRNPLGPEGTRAFADSKNLPGLTQLILTPNHTLFVHDACMREVDRAMASRKQAQQRAR